MEPPVIATVAAACVAMEPSPRPVRAVACVVPDVPPWATDSAVVRPDMDVISLLAPDAAVPRAVRAADGVMEPVPP
ncbi:hypothetical protein CN09_09100 [Rhizobium rhizogenes]|nr:hypothetical protein CN09_09100 [Rhizobium rhizogenes]